MVRRAFARRPELPFVLDADTVSRVVIRDDRALLAVANATLFPFERIHPGATRPFLDRLASIWRPGEIEEAFREASLGWLERDLAALDAETRADPDLHPSLTATVLEAGPGGARYATIGTSGARLFRGGALVAQTPLDNLRTLTGQDSIHGHLVVRSLSPRGERHLPHVGILAAQSGDRLMLYDSAALDPLGKGAEAPDLDAFESFRGRHDLLYASVIEVRWTS